MSTSAWNETDRLAALQSYEILDSERDPAFDDITGLISRLCDAPIAVVNLIDADRQWFKSEVGLGVRETPLETSFCRHALLEQDRLVVPNADQDPRFACNPLVTATNGLKFYAGVLLKGDDGLPLGTLCVLDTRPRPEGLTPLQSEALEVLASQVMKLLNLRKVLAAGRQADADLSVTAAALAESEARFRAIADSMPQMVWSTLPDGFHDYYNARWYEFTGARTGSTDGEGWNGMFHPEDQERAMARWRHSLETGDPYEIEYRLRRADGVYRWALGRATPIRNEAGEIARWFGTCTDIEDLKRAVESKDLLSQELSHRIKNIFAVVSALIALSARQFPEARAFASAARTRIAALARAHEFVRPHTETSRPSLDGTTLHAFLGDLFRAYDDEAGAPRVLVSGDDADFDDQTATPVALLFHELATNAAKYGALSVPEGRVLLTTLRQGERYVMTWQEQGGPPVRGKPAESGFGSSLLALSVEGQLSGRLEQTWAPGGLNVVADVPATALAPRRAARRLR